MTDIPILEERNEAPMPRLWAFVSRDQQGKEGILSAVIGNQHMPLVTGTERLLPKMEQIARNVARRSSQQVVLVEYSGRRDIRVMTP